MNVLAQISDKISQNNSIALKSEPNGRHIVVTWLKPNETRLNDSQVVSINKQDFWNTLNPLLEHLIPSNNYK